MQKTAYELRISDWSSDVCSSDLLAEAVDCEVAILDININGERSEPIAALLAQRGIPCIYATGYGRAGIGAPADALVIEKPYSRDVLARSITLAFAQPGKLYQQQADSEAGACHGGGDHQRKRETGRAHV